MSYKQNYWQALLTEWRKKGRDGFTIPFIIGIKKYLEENQIKQNIEELILDIINNGSLQVYLKYCITTEDIVLGIRDETKLNLQGSFPSFSNSTTQSFLFLTSFLNDLGSDVEIIISSLVEKYQQYINAGQFSKFDRKRENFQPDELEFINSVFK